MNLDTRNSLKFCGSYGPVHSPNFNPSGWDASQSALGLANAPKGALTLRNPISGAMVAPNVDKLTAMRFNARVESAKVVNTESVTDSKRAELLGLTVKALRAKCKVAGLTRYSKAKKTALVNMLA